MDYYDRIIRNEHARRAKEYIEAMKTIARLEVKNHLLRQEVLDLQARIAELETERFDMEQ